MKSFATIIVAAGLVAAQSVPSLSGLPQCGQTCVGNMLAKAGELGCGSTDVACLCKNVDFRYGIRDCTAAICNSADMATTVNFGNNVCAQYTSGAVTATVTATTTVGTATVVVSTGTDSNGNPVASTLATVVVTTFTESNGATVTSTIGAGGAGGAGVVTTFTEANGTTVTSTIGAGGAGGIVTTLTGGDLSAFTSATAAAGASSASVSASNAAASLASAASSLSSVAANAGKTSTSNGAAAPLQTPFIGGLAAGALAAIALL